jgi:hypothetical protein
MSAESDKRLITTLDKPPVFGEEFTFISSSVSEI